MPSAFEKLAPNVQKRILNSAATVFAQEGYHHASISNICIEAEISNGALYKYFKNKESLFFAVLDNGIQLVEELYKTYMQHSVSIFGAIRDFLTGLHLFSEENRHYSRIYCDLGSSSMNRFAAVASEKYRNATSRYTIQLVGAAKDTGEIDEGMDTNIAAYMIDSYISLFSYCMVSDYQMKRFCSFFAPDGTLPEIDEMIDIIVISLRQALGRRPFFEEKKEQLSAL